MQQVLRYHVSGRLPLVLRGKEFSLKELRVILGIISRYPDANRTQLSQEICRQLDWVQPNGWLKERACRDVLLSLQKRRLVELPPRQRKARHGKPPQAKTLHKHLVKGLDLQSPVIAQPQSLRFEFAKGNQAERLWNYLVDEYHYLGYKASVGRVLKYLIWGDDRLLGAIGFSSAVWRLKARDELVEKMGWAPEDCRARVINNFRFLILPHVKVEALASRVLASVADEVLVDWTWFYGVKPQIIETFVSPSRFQGTSYKAANWVRVGQTRGFAKSGASHRNSQEPKHVFLYGLTRSTRSWLWRTVTIAEEA